MKLPNAQKIIYSPILGWKSRLVQRGKSFYIVLDKRIISAALLKPKDFLFAYFGLTTSQRPLAVVFLDSKNLANSEE
ncbi:MAG: hypothetical protein QXQ79_00575 [Candidatus Nanoarchaeia archaeon]